MGAWRNCAPRQYVENIQEIKAHHCRDARAERKQGDHGRPKRTTYFRPMPDTNFPEGISGFRKQQRFVIARTVQNVNHIDLRA